MKHIHRYFWIVFLLLSSCKTISYAPSRVVGKQLAVTDIYPEKESIVAFIAPFQKHLQGEMSKVLAYNPTDLKKDRQSLNNPLSNLMAQAGYEQAAAVFSARMGKQIDFALFNTGGIRSDLPQGDVTTESAYKLMPFENKLMVVELLGEQLYEMADYLIKARLSHPISHQLELHFYPDGTIASFKVNGQPVQQNQKYYVCTTDYLYRGGDKMDFLAKGNATDLNYNYRHALIDYFTKIDTIKPVTDQRFYQLEK